MLQCYIYPIMVTEGNNCTNVLKKFKQTAAKINFNLRLFSMSARFARLRTRGIMSNAQSLQALFPQYKIPEFLKVLFLGSQIFHQHTSDIFEKLS